MSFEDQNLHVNAARFDALDADYSAQMSAQNECMNTYWYVSKYKPMQSSFARLATSRTERKHALIGKLEKEFELHPERLAGADIRLVRARVHLMADALLKLKNTYFSMSLTQDESIYGRMNLAARKGTLHIEMFLSESLDEDPDTFITLYKEESQMWSLAGGFKEMLLKLKEKMSIA